MKTKSGRLFCFCAILLVVFSLILSSPVYASVPGTDTDGAGNVDVGGSIDPVVTETGFISLSVDGVGTNAESGTVQVDKPAGATVRSAYFAAASTGFSDWSIPNGSVSIDGAGVNWDTSTPSAIHSWNYWANVTSLVKSKIDLAPAGLIDFTITETDTLKTDGEILAVIFDDPGQATSNTIILLFGAQDVPGDTFNITLATPLDKSDPDLGLDFSLGISFGYQTSDHVVQYSVVDINGHRLTTSAGGQDDFQSTVANGALLTVGGIGDTNTNPPDPYALATGYRYDDELYSLLPFVDTGDTNITVYYRNPSEDDNIFFGALFLSSVAGQVTKGLVLMPIMDANPVGTSHTVIATYELAGVPQEGVEIDFVITAGPNAGDSGSNTTGVNGQVGFTYTGDGGVGTDTIWAEAFEVTGDILASGEAIKEWAVPTLLLIPPSAANPEYTSHTVTATYSLAGVPQEGVKIDFAITAGPNFGESGSETTDAYGEASFTYKGDGGKGTDTIQATAFTASGSPLVSAQVTKYWTAPVPGISQWGIAVLVVLLGGALVWVIRRKQLRRETP